MKDTNLEKYQSLADILQADTKSEVTFYQNWNNIYFQSDENDLMIRDNTKVPQLKSITLARISLNHRHNGTGTKIIQWLEAYAKETHAERIIIESVLTRPMAELSLKLGYIPENIDTMFTNYLKTPNAKV